MQAKIKEYIKGIHHVTATVNDAQEDFDFYTKLLGLRLVKKTVNFDNNKVYHFYYGTEVGAPGTIMTTFPYKDQGVRIGTIGTGQASITGFSVPMGSLNFWMDRLDRGGVDFNAISKFDKHLIQFRDPSGLILELIENDEDERSAWQSRDISREFAIRGIFNVTLLIAEKQDTEDFLMHVFGFSKGETEGSITRFIAKEGGAGQYVDIQEAVEGVRGKNGLGTVHHVAWRIETEEEQEKLREFLVDQLGMKVTEIKDRKYFRSIYFRIPGGVLFEVATIPPGFQVDEKMEELGEDLKLPDWEEGNRAEIEEALPKIN
ncbi:MAG: ring-cleaving dioxygenase [Bacteroidota bacterium]